MFSRFYLSIRALIDICILHTVILAPQYESKGLLLPALNEENQVTTLKEEITLGAEIWSVRTIYVKPYDISSSNLASLYANSLISSFKPWTHLSNFCNEKRFFSTSTPCPELTWELLNLKRKLGYNSKIIMRNLIWKKFWETSPTVWSYIFSYF